MVGCAPENLVPLWSYGRCLAIRYDPDTGVMFGVASPRTGEPYVVGW